MYFRPDHLISERVIFPVSKNESRGIEDARFVQFFDKLPRRKQRGINAPYHKERGAGAPMRR
jgi:hypothetical protein